MPVVGNANEWDNLEMRNSAREQRREMDSTGTLLVPGPRTRPPVSCVATVSRPHPTWAQDGESMCGFLSIRERNRCAHLEANVVALDRENDVPAPPATGRAR